MSEPRETFMAALRAGRVRLEDIDDWIDAWHEDDSPEGRGQGLRDFLGMTWEQYQAFVTHGTLPAV